MRKVTNKEAINILKRGYPDINRYAASELKAYEYSVEIYNEALALAVKALEERPQGEWYYNYQNGWHCSICHESVKDMPTVMGKANFAFCPNCGAKMGGGSE